MQGRFRLPAGAGLPTLSLRVTVALCTLVVAAAALAVGLVGLLATGPEGALAAPELGDAADGPVHVAGTVERSWVDGGQSATLLVLRGAPGVEVRVAGTAAGPFAPGDYIEVVGTKDAGRVEAASVRSWVDPVDRAAPWLAVAAVLLAALATWPIAWLRGRRSSRPQGPGGHGGPGPLGRLLDTLRRRGGPPDGPAPPAE